MTQNTASESQPVGQQAKEQAGQVAEQAQEQASHVVGIARQQMKSQLSNQKGRLAGQVDSVAGALEETGQQLRQQNHSVMADYTETTAQQLKRVSQQVQQKDVGEFIREAENAARRRPGLLVGGAFALGLLGARFLKSSPPSTTDRSLQSGAGTAGSAPSYYESSGSQPSVGDPAAEPLPPGGGVSPPPPDRAT